MQRIEELGCEEIICLGDILGYGPDPILCLDTVIERCQLTILGNHDQAALFDPESFNPLAMRAIFWTRKQLEQDSANVEKSDQRWDFLGELPRRHDEGEVLFVHGSPRDPTNEYVFPETVYEPHFNLLMSRFEKTCFQGHTHIPGVFLENGQFQVPADHNHVFNLNDNQKRMINVGSVGQPRDGDARSCFVVFDSEEKTVKYVRVEYPWEVTRRKIYDISDLDNQLGDRLGSGR